MKSLLFLPFLLACSTDVFSGQPDGDDSMLDGSSFPDTALDGSSGIDGGDGATGLDGESGSDAKPEADAVVADADAGSTCTPVTLAGPTPTTNTSAAPIAQSGLKFTALSNATLTGFTIHNQGLAGTVTLTDTSLTVLQTTSLPASSSTYKATVSWLLTAGTTYYLLLAGGMNGRYATYSSYPTADSDIKVIASYFEGDSTTFWFTFTDLVSCP